VKRRDDDGHKTAKILTRMFWVSHMNTFSPLNFVKGHFLCSRRKSQIFNALHQSMLV